MATVQENVHTVNRHSVEQEKHAELIKTALENGMDRAKIIPTGLIVVEKRAQMRCLIPRCTSYGKSHTCPPNTPSTEEVRTLVGEYRHGLLMQVDGSEEKDGTSDILKRDYNWCYPSSYKLAEALHETEKRAFDLGYPMAMGLGGGDCRWCEILRGGIEAYGDDALLHANAGGCGFANGEHCYKEYRARPALEAMSVNVLATAANAGMPFFFSGKEYGRITWMGIVLLD